MRYGIRLLVGLAAILQLLQPAKARPAQQYPAPGKLIEIGDRKLHLLCSGSGNPTVILVAGGGAFSIDWALVQPKVAVTTRVCSYDRAGLGWSETGPADETVEQTISDLHAVLRSAGESGRYVLVGASISGIFIRAYQRAYPEEITALVFTNSSNRVGIVSQNGGGGLLWEVTEDDVRGAFPTPAAAKGPRPMGIGEPFNRLPTEIQPVRVDLDVAQWERWEKATASPASTLSWRREFLREFDEMDGPRQPLGKLPVVVVASGLAASESDRGSRMGVGWQLNFLSSNTLHIEAKGSGHEIHLFQPERVVEGIVRAVSAVRTGLPLSSP
jgi:pimeloyl-ACP methyl ester carboxylesterase